MLKQIGIQIQYQNSDNGEGGKESNKKDMSYPVVSESYLDRINSINTNRTHTRKGKDGTTYFLYSEKSELYPAEYEKENLSEKEIAIIRSVMDEYERAFDIKFICIDRLTPEEKTKLTENFQLTEFPETPDTVLFRAINTVKNSFAFSEFPPYSKDKIGYIMVTKKVYFDENELDYPSEWLITDEIKKEARKWGDVNQAVTQETLEERTYNKIFIDLYKYNIMHELGHGALGFEHPFMLEGEEDDFVAQQLGADYTNMDYPNLAYNFDQNGNLLGDQENYTYSYTIPENVLNPKITFIEYLAGIEKYGPSKVTEGNYADIYKLEMDTYRKELEQREGDEFAYFKTERDNLVAANEVKAKNLFHDYVHYVMDNEDYVKSFLQATTDGVFSEEEKKDLTLVTDNNDGSYNYEFNSTYIKIYLTGKEYEALKNNPEDLQAYVAIKKTLADAINAKNPNDKTVGDTAIDLIDKENKNIEVTKGADNGKTTYSIKYKNKETFSREF